MIYEIKSKKTGKVMIIEESTYQQLIANGSIKKYTVEQKHEPKKVIPQEIIEKRIIPDEIKKSKKVKHDE